MVEKLDIVGGLKNALERGRSLDEVKQSFINAGYNSKDVEDSSRALNSGVLFLSTSPRSQGSVSSYKPLEPAKKEETQKDRKGLALVIILAVILVLLVGVLLASVFAKDKILEILKSIGILR